MKRPPNIWKIEREGDKIRVHYWRKSSCAPEAYILQLVIITKPNQNNVCTIEFFRHENSPLYPTCASSEQEAWMIVYAYISYFLTQSQRYITDLTLTVCPFCHRYTVDQTAVITCPHCQRQIAARCARCGVLTPVKDSIRWNGKVYCRSCVEYIQYCQEC